MQYKGVGGGGGAWLAYFPHNWAFFLHSTIILLWKCRTISKFLAHNISKFTIKTVVSHITDLTMKSFTLKIYQQAW